MSNDHEAIRIVIRTKRAEMKRISSFGYAEGRVKELRKQIKELEEHLIALAGNRDTWTPKAWREAALAA